jgi:hypothetical protein
MMKEPRPVDVGALIDFLLAAKQDRSGPHTIQWSCNKPSELDQNPFFIWHFHASRFPNGVTITDCGIDTPSAASTYSVDFKRYDDPTDGSPDTIETVATSASYQAEDDGTIDNPDIAAGDMLAVNLPATDIDSLLVWITFTID